MRLITFVYPQLHGNTLISENGINSGINLAEIIDNLDGIGIADCLKKANLSIN